MITLSNKNIQAKISEHGAELHSLIHNGYEYIWQADPKYWGRHAPILFPIVGRLFNDEYRIGDKKYTLSQHGFARDKVIRPLGCSGNYQHTFMLKTDSDSYNCYPYHFNLIISYELSGKQLKVTIAVYNEDNKELFFQIGGHPAFYYPDRTLENRGYLQFNKDSNLLSQLLVRHPNASGYIQKGIQHINLTDGILPISENTFDNGVWILEDNQCDSVTLLDKNKQPHVTLSSNHANVFGIWSPKHTKAPFICIEPWMGRADEEGYNGEFKDRPFMNKLPVFGNMTFEYTITFP